MSKEKKAPAPSSLAGGEVREKVARIVDPETFALIAHYTGIERFDGLSPAEREPAVFKAYPDLKAARDAAYADADAILAALSPEAPAREGDESFDNVEARAEAWSDRAEIQRMVEATTGVFAKWSSPEILSRFRQQFMAVIQQAYIEGYDAALSPEAPEREGGDLEGLLTTALTDELQDGGAEVPYSIIAERVAARVADEASAPSCLTPRHEAPVFHANLMSHEDNEAWAKLDPHEAPAEGAGEAAIAKLFDAVEMADDYNRLSDRTKRLAKDFLLDSELRDAVSSLRARSSAPEA